MNKKGLELAIGTIVLIILGILVLVALLVILNQQTGFFSKFLKNLQGESNIDSLVVSCNSLVAQNAVYDFCCVKREVELGNSESEKGEEEKNEEKLMLTCNELSERGFTGSRISKLNCENAGC